MRAVVQRVSEASVAVDDQTVGQIDTGLMVLLGVTHDDTEATARTLAAKVWRLRIMRGEKSAEDLGAGILVVSQFTLYADTKKGRRPTWAAAAPSAIAKPLYECFCQELRILGAQVAEGIFGADMEILLTNDGPTTLILEE